MANIQKGDSLASDSVTECYVGTVTHFRNESRKERNSSNVNAGDKQQAEQVQTGSNQNGIVATTTTVTAKDNTGNSFSETFILRLVTHNMYDKTLFIHLPVQYMETTSSEHVKFYTQIDLCFCFDIQNNLCTQHVMSL